MWELLVRCVRWWWWQRASMCGNTNTFARGHPYTKMPTDDLQCASVSHDCHLLFTCIHRARSFECVWVSSLVAAYLCPFECSAKSLYVSWRMRLLQHRLRLITSIAREKKRCTQYFRDDFRMHGATSSHTHTSAPAVVPVHGKYSSTHFKWSTDTTTIHSRTRRTAQAEHTHNGAKY